MPKLPGKGQKGLKVVRRPGSPFYYIRGTAGGRSVHESSGTRDRATAQQAAAALQARLDRNQALGIVERARVTFGQAADAYLDRPVDRPVQQNTVQLVARLVKHFGPSLAVTEITQDTIDTAARALCRPGATASTVQRTIATPVRAILTYASERGWCDVPRFRKSKAGGRRTDWFAPAEAEALILHAAGHVKPLLTFLFCTGARISEATALDWRDVDLAHARCTLRDTKSGSDRAVDLPARAVAALSGMPGRKGMVFLTPSGRPETAKKWIPYSDGSKTAWGGTSPIRRSWKNAMAAAGIDRPLTPHNARHSAATWHYAVHRDPYLLRDWGGWAKAEMVERYTHAGYAGLGAEALAFWGAAPVLVERAAG